MAAMSEKQTAHSCAYTTPKSVIRQLEQTTQKQIQTKKKKKQKTLTTIYNKQHYAQLANGNI